MLSPPFKALYHVEIKADKKNSIKFIHQIIMGSVVYQYLVNTIV